MTFSLAKNIGRFIGLILITVFAIAVMFASGARPWKTSKVSPPSETPETTRRIVAKAPVLVRRVEAEQIEILLTSSGMIHPFERYQVKFELSGRVKSIGKNESGQMLDVGDRVQAGQVLAVLDRRVLLARKQESSARLEQAQNDILRAQQIKEINRSAITVSEFQKLVTAVKIAKAQDLIAEKNIEDATLLAPASGVISRRHIKLEDSVGSGSELGDAARGGLQQDSAFEIVQVDRLLLIVGVPESRIHEIVARKKIVEKNQLQARKTRQQPLLAPEDLTFKVNVQLMGKDRFGYPWPVIAGKVYRISETADEKTGMFAVEILLPNQDRAIRPGQIARAEIVVDRIDGYRLPLSSVLFRDGKAAIYSVETEESEKGKQFIARKFQIDRYLEQGEYLIIPAPHFPEKYHTAIVQGQHRITDGRLVEIITEPGELGEQPPSSSIDIPSIGTKP